MSIKFVSSGALKILFLVLNTIPRGLRHKNNFVRLLQINMNPINARKILSIPFCKLTAAEVLAAIGKAIERDEQLLLTVLDVAMVVNMKNNLQSYEAICASDVIVADGYYVALALRFLGHGSIEQITGFDTALNVLQLAKVQGYKVFFFGAEESVVRNVVTFAEKSYGSSIIAGFRNGYFDACNTEAIIEEINCSGADILFVGISSPIRELLLHQYRNHLKASFLMGVGGVFDILGGKTQRAPELIIQLKLEWLYRFLLEPKRMWRRVFYAYPYFVSCVLIERFSKFLQKNQEE